MKFAAHTMGTPELTLREAITLFSSQGFDGIEIIWDDEFKCAIPKRTANKDLSELKRNLAESGLEVCCLTPYMFGINALDIDQRRRDFEDFQRCIDVGGRIRASCIRVYGGGYNPNKDGEKRQDLEEILIDSLRRLGEGAAAVGVVLAVETHFNTLTCTASETADIVRRVNHPNVQVLYDQPNLEFSEGEKHSQALEILAGLIAMVHVKDLVYKESISGGFTASRVVTVDESERRVSSRIPGEGIIPWPEIMPALAAQGFDDWLSLEYERRWYPYDLPPAAEGMKQGLDYMRSLAAKLG
jgi:sugar phosphate isomerase/epimerase